MTTQRPSSRPRTRGFIALISILILSSVLLVTVLSLAQFGIASRVFLLDLEEKKASELLAEGCVHIARVYVYRDPDITVDTLPTIPPHPHGTFPIGESACTISAISRSNTINTVEVVAHSGRATTRYSVLIRNANGEFLSWLEI